MLKSAQTWLFKRIMSMTRLSNLKIDIYIIYNSTLKSLNSSDHTAHTRRLSLLLRFQSKGQHDDVIMHPPVWGCTRWGRGPLFSSPSVPLKQKPTTFDIFAPIWYNADRGDSIWAVTTSPEHSEPSWLVQTPPRPHWLLYVGLNRKGQYLTP